MGESFLAGTEYRDSTRKETELELVLGELKGRKWLATLKNDEITVLVEGVILVKEVIKRENRVETGHLTLDDVYFDLVNDLGIKMFFPVVQFKHFVKYSKSINIYFDSYWWTFQLVQESI